MGFYVDLPKRFVLFTVKLHSVVDVLSILPLEY